MAAVTPPFTLQNSAAHTAKLFRRALGGLLGSEGVAAFNTPSPFGVSGDLAVTQRGAGANMSVDIARGGAYVLGDDATDQGYYFVYNDATFNVVIAAADPTNPRIDLIIARVKDVAEGGAAGDTWTLEVVAGTPAGSPSAPALPASALKLAQVAVAAAAASITNANITDFRSMATTSLYERPTPACKVYNNGAPTLASGSTTPLAFNTEVYDTDGLHSTVTNTSRITIPTGLGGKWLVMGAIQFGPNIGGQFRAAFIQKNGLTVSESLVPRVNSATIETAPNISTILQLAPNDYLELVGWHDAGSALGVGNGSETGTWFSATRIA